MTRRHRQIALRFGGASALLVAILLNGCATLGGNVKGSFACAAPDGICAPSSSIDDRALAMISGDDSAAELLPSRSLPDGASRPKAFRMTAAQAPARWQQAGAGRTQERVLKIVFRPYIDDRGRLHDTSTVHAVVLASQWREQALVLATPLPGERDGDGGPSLSEAIDRADPAGGTLAAIDPNLPDDAEVAAARARAKDPIAAIRADVAARLAPGQSRVPRDVPGASGISASTLTATTKPGALPIVRAAGFPATVSDD